MVVFFQILKYIIWRFEMNLLSFGEIVWDIFCDNRYLGGAPFNFAAHSVALGAKVGLVSAVGDDELGKTTIKQIEGFGINTEYISVISGKETGKCLVTLNENAVPTYEIVDDAAYDHIQMPKLNENIDVIAFGSLAIRREKNKSVLKALLDRYSFSEVFVDINIRAPYYSAESIMFCLENATILKISEEELSTVTEIVFGETLCSENATKKISKNFNHMKTVIITRGEKGSFCYDCKTSELFVADAVQAKVVSTVGAGDSFGAAFLAMYMENKSYDKCLEFAAEISALVCSQAEAVPKDMSKLIKSVTPY